MHSQYAAGALMKTPVTQIPLTERLWERRRASHICLCDSLQSFPQENDEKARSWKNLVCLTGTNKLQDAGCASLATQQETLFNARVAELADALDLGSSVQWTWGFESPLSHFRGTPDSPPNAHKPRTSRGFGVLWPAGGKTGRTPHAADWCRL